MLFDYLEISFLNPSYRPSGAAGDLHPRVWTNLTSLSARGVAPTSGGWCSGACGVPRLHSGDAGSRGASELTAPTHVRLSVR